MGKTTRKRYTREFKLSLIRELESGKKLGQLTALTDGAVKHQS